MTDRATPGPTPPVAAPRPALSTEFKNSTYEVFMGLLSVLSVVNVFLLFVAIDPVVKDVVRLIDLFLSTLFLLDFGYRLYTADSRAAYLLRQYGWADLLSAIPFPGFKLLRLFRIWRAVRVMRRYGARNLEGTFVDNPANSALLSVLLLIILLLEFGSIGIVVAERSSPDSNIKSASDAIWWAYVTITTVGYGDRFPVTSLGRLWGMLVLSAGVGLFGVLTGYLANAFVKPRRRRLVASAAWPSPDDPRAHLSQIKDALQAQRAHQDDLEAKLAELERLLAR